MRTKVLKAIDIVRDRLNAKPKSKAKAIQETSKQTHYHPTIVQLLVPLARMIHK